MKKFFASAMVVCTIAFSVQSCREESKPTTTEKAPEKPTTPEVKVEGNVNVNPADFKGAFKSGDKVVLDATKTYYMKGAVIVGDGATLTIPAGTKIVCSGGTDTYLAVAQGGQIFANGTSEKPVVFEGAKDEKAQWGGIVICGKARTNIPAGTKSEVADLPYGGDNDNDNSGVLKYVVIKNSGARFNEKKEYNGLSLFAVGSGTTIDGLALIDSADDGIEFFGGNVNVSNIVSINNDDDAFDWTEGWRGTATNVYGKRLDAKVGNRGLEADNNEKNYKADPVSNPTLKNITLIGFTTTDNEQYGTSLLRRGTAVTIDNAVFSGWKTGISIESDDITSANFYGKNKLTNLKFINCENTVKGYKEDKSLKDIVVYSDVPANTFTESNSAKGAGNGVDLPDWAKGWSGLK